MGAQTFKCFRSGILIHLFPLLQFRRWLSLHSCWLPLAGPCSGVRLSELCFWWLRLLAVVAFLSSQALLPQLVLACLLDRIPHRCFAHKLLDMVLFLPFPLLPFALLPFALLDALRFCLPGSPFGGFCCRASGFAALIYLGCSLPAPLSFFSLSSSFLRVLHRTFVVAIPTTPSPQYILLLQPYSALTTILHNHTAFLLYRVALAGLCQPSLNTACLVVAILFSSIPSKTLGSPSLRITCLSLHYSEEFSTDSYRMTEFY